ncbi:hypothetical protein PENTCL1PPCAC_8411, partial [Pristionchus entomophagus]
IRIHPDRIRGSVDIMRIPNRPANTGRSFFDIARSGGKYVLNNKIQTRTLVAGTSWDVYSHFSLRAMINEAERSMNEGLNITLK